MFIDEVNTGFKLGLQCLGAGLTAHVCGKRVNIYKVVVTSWKVPDLVKAGETLQLL